MIVLSLLLYYYYMIYSQNVKQNRYIMLVIYTAGCFAVCTNTSPAASRIENSIIYIKTNIYLCHDFHSNKTVEWMKWNVQQSTARLPLIHQCQHHTAKYSAPS